MKRKNVKEEMKKYFFINPTIRLRVRQIERMLGLPLPSIIRYCKELEGEGVLKKTEIAGIQTYSADRTSRKYLIEKRLSNIKLIFDSGLIDFLIRDYSNPAIVLFGSYSKGEDIEGSDIDLYIQTSSKKQIKLENFEKLLKRKIQLFVHSSLKQIGNHHLANNIINGITLNGFLEVF